MAAFDGEDDLAGVAGVVVVEVEAAVDAAIGTLLDAFGGAGSAEAERPVLELVFVLFGELGGSGYVGGFANDLVGFADVVAEGIVEAGLDEADGEVGDVDADPAAVEFLRAWITGPRRPQKRPRITTTPPLEETLSMRSSKASGFCVG